MDINVLDGDALLTLAAVTVEGLGQSPEVAGEFVRLVQVLAPTFEGLLTDHRAPVALHGGVMTRDRLRDQHSFERIARLHAHHGGERCIDLALIGNGILAGPSPALLVAQLRRVSAFSIASLSNELLPPSSLVCLS